VKERDKAMKVKKKKIKVGTNVPARNNTSAD
jgi:hypothetical protein